MIIDHVEATDKDGAIVVLDQEKAYNKIKHDYLWKTLKEFSVPQPFIKTAKELYKHTFTKVAVNGCCARLGMVVSVQHSNWPTVFFVLGIKSVRSY